MTIAELMQTNLKTTDPEATIADAITTLADAHVSALPVVDAKRRLVGVLSTSDILEAEAECASAADREHMFSETQVKDIMTPRPAVIAPDAAMREAAQQMLYLEVHRLFVEDKGKLVGVVSQTDIVRAVALARV
jgi:CBS domain-containing protein